MNKNKIKSETQETCPIHLVKKTKLFTGNTTPSGEWEEAYFCLLDTYYGDTRKDISRIYNSGMTGICITPMGNFRTHYPQRVGSTRHLFGPDEDHYICRRCGTKHTELYEGGGGEI